MDFNVAEPPVFAKKSAPPPPEPEPPTQSGATVEMEGQEGSSASDSRGSAPGARTFATFPSPTNCSTPSSSILNSSNDNSRNRTREEPMEMDEPTTPKIPMGVMDKENLTDNGKRSRNRSKAKRNLGKDKDKKKETDLPARRPDIDKLLAGLEPQPEMEGQDQGQEGINEPPINPSSPSKQIPGTKKPKPKYSKQENSAATYVPSSQGGAKSKDTTPPLPPNPQPLPPPPPPPPAHSPLPLASEQSTAASGASKRGGSRGRGGSQRTAGRSTKAQKAGKEDPKACSGTSAGPSSLAAYIFFF